MVGVKTSLRRPTVPLKIEKISLGEKLFKVPKVDSRNENLIEALLLSLGKNKK